MPDMNNIIDKLNHEYESTLQQGTGDAYGRLSTAFEDMGAFLREYIQDLTQQDIKSIINKLKNEETLTAADKEQIRNWIVGDAQYYTKMENNYSDWQDEVKRVVGEINGFRDNTLDVVNASKLRGLLRDGSRVLADIFYYVEQRDRIDKFEKAIKNLGPSECELLAGILNQKLNSPDF